MDATNIVLAVQNLFPEAQPAEAVRAANKAIQLNRAGEQLSQLAPNQTLPLSAIPKLAEGSARYRYTVRVDFKDPISGEQDHFYATVNSDTNLSKGEIYAQALNIVDNNLSGFGLRPNALSQGAENVTITIDTASRI